MDIENLGTSAVMDAIARTDLLSSFANSGDKEPSWAGHIYAFSYASKSKKYITMHYCLMKLISCLRIMYEYLFNHDTYLYAENKELNYQVPICHMWRIESAKTELKVSVCANGKEYFKSCEIFHMPGCDEIHFGKSIVFKEPYGGNPNMVFSLKGNIDERISAIGFVLAIFEEQAIVVDGIYIKTRFSVREIEKFGIEGLKTQLRHLKTVKRVLESLDVQIPLECDNLTDKDENYIKMLLLGIKHGELISFKDEKVPAIGHMLL